MRQLLFKHTNDLSGIRDVSEVTIDLGFKGEPNTVENVAHDYGKIVAGLWMFFNSVGLSAEVIGESLLAMLEDTPDKEFFEPETTEDSETGEHMTFDIFCTKINHSPEFVEKLFTIYQLYNNTENSADDD